MDRSFSEEEIDQFLRALGVDIGQGKKAYRNLYRILGAIPEIDDHGNRLLTPYEILSVPPQFRNGAEVPIVFAIKNRTAKIGHFTGTERLFYYVKKHKTRDQSSIDSILSELKKKYRSAVFTGNMDEAASYIDMINELSGGRADEVMGFFYNYAIFYKKMKKQLLMDMFAHFFLTYIFKYRTSIKEGIMDTSVHFRPYIEKSSFTLDSSAIKDISSQTGILDSPKADFGNIKELKIDIPDMDLDVIPEMAQPTPAPVTTPAPQGVSPAAEVKIPEQPGEPEQTPQSFVKIKRSVKPTLLEMIGLDLDEGENSAATEPEILGKVEEEKEEMKSLD